MKKTTSKIIFFLSLIGLLAACQAGAVTPTKTIPTPDIAAIWTAAVETASAQLTLTAAPTPSSTPAPPLIVFSPGEAPSFITARGSLPILASDYLLYNGPLTHGLGYISIDSTQHGDLLSYHSAIKGTDRYADLFVTSSTEAPKLVFVDRGKDEINIWVTDLGGNLLKSLHGKVIFDARNECYEPWILSSGHWLVLRCGPENRALNYFVDLSSPNETISSLGLDCNAGYNDVTSSFPYNEAEWILWCNKPWDYCFISRFENKKVCVDLSNVIKSSPADLSEAALVEGDMPHGSDGTVPGIRIVVFDRACLLKESPCGPSREFELPYYQPIAAEKLTAPSLEFQWGKDGKSLAWLLAPFGRFGQLNTRGIGPANSGVINLTENTSQVLWQGLPANTDLDSWSPDGNWLLFHDEKGLYIGSIKGQNIRRLVAAQNYGAAFYGWLVIP